MVQALGAAPGARAVLLAAESRGTPFDEACTRLCLQMQKLLPAFPNEPACFGATVEPRGEADNDHHLARQDAAAHISFLAHQGALTCKPAPLPEPLCQATPLSGFEPITAPCSGVVVFRHKPGDTVAAGTLGPFKTIQARFKTGSICNRPSSLNTHRNAPRYDLTDYLAGRRHSQTLW